MNCHKMPSIVYSFGQIHFISSYASLLNFLSFIGSFLTQTLTHLTVFGYRSYAFLGDMSHDYDKHIN